MKKIIVLSVFVVSCLFSFSQNNQIENNKIKPLSISFSSGQGALSSGPLLSANFSRNKDIINFTIGERDVYVAYLKNVYKNIYSGLSMEYFHNIPVLGIMNNIGIYKKDFIKISMLNWTGFSAGKPGDKASFKHSQLLFFFHSLDLSYKQLSIRGAALWYEEWGYLFELKYKQPLTDKFSAFTSAGYNFHKEGDYLFSIGLCYTF